jgi:glycosyltransferase involved in cell wall biosynthesis
MPKVSIIIPCYNQSEFIAEAIDSVKKQRFTDYEVIIINDGSTEKGAVEFLNKFADHHTTVLHIANSGVSAARNYAIKHSNGEYILPLDADDCIDELFLYETVAVLDTTPEVQVVRTGVKYFGALNHEEILPVYSRRRHLLQNLFFNTTLFRKSSFLNAGGYDEQFLIGWEDWDLFLQLVERESQVYTIERPYCFYRIKLSSRNADLQEEKKQKAEQQLYKKYLASYLQYFPQPLSLLRELEFLQAEKAAFEQIKKNIYLSASYRLGHAILSPLKMIKQFLRK